MEKQKAIRHGDLLLVVVDKIPEGLEESKTKVIMAGNNGHDHKFNKGKLYLRSEGEFIIGYFESVEGTIFTHMEHGEKGRGKLRTANIPVNKYQLRKQNEDTHEGMKPVID